MKSSRGTVATFDEHAGFGILRADEGVELFFHCTQLLDGSRTIDVDTEVRFDVVPGHAGRWEAIRVEKIQAGRVEKIQAGNVEKL